MKSFKNMISEETKKFKKNDTLDGLKMITVKKKPIIIKCCKMEEPFEVETLEGTMKGKKGDYLMVGVQGELYPCDTEVFDQTYDIVEE